ncbi:hypothetical protein HNR61_007778 [Actinomadura namibiensis]|uniref:Secreted protein n=2 Tax=Actinomadura TaxID=1988 RepID=A0A7W3QQX8_ACTNM|nr:hypothetical protein [Actinomadura namibiensis]MBA8956096.1 hypothetical protein [Actinomadura namibiensis]
MLAVPVVAVLPMGVTANAASASAARVCVSATSYISNQGSVGVGVMHDWRGTGNLYVQGLYDKVLPVGQRTDCAAGFGWGQARGYYIGPGWCAELRTTNSAGKWYTYDIVRSGQRARPNLGRTIERWEVNPVACT